MGHVILSAWRAIFYGNTAEEIKARACLEGLNWATEWAKKKAILESDCSNVIKSI